MSFSMPPGIDALTPPQRTRVILAEARHALDRQLWDAALGSGTGAIDGGGAAAPPCACREGGADWTDLSTLLGMGQRPAAPATPNPPGLVDDTASPPSRSMPAGDFAARLGVNARHADVLTAAAERTGIAPAALAAIIDAEAAKDRNGAWIATSRNPRSSAAGLGQFLAGTWIGLAQTPGSDLHAIARARGWIGDNGRVLRAARADLLALRFDPAVAIGAIADYSAANLRFLERAGVARPDGVEGTARLAYMAHYLGPGDALRHLSGTLSERRARVLLSAQVGAGAAASRVASSGSATAAHAAWLDGHLARHIRPARYG